MGRLADGGRAQIPSLRFVVAGGTDLARTDTSFTTVTRGEVRGWWVEHGEPARQLADSMVDSIIFVAPDGRITYANRSAHVLFDCGSDMLIGAPVTLLVPEPLAGSDPARLAAIMHRKARRSQHRPIEVVARKQNGKHLLIEATLVIVDGVDRTCAAILRDMSAQRRAERDLERARRGERRALRRLGSARDMQKTVLRAVAHELTDPLTALRTISGLLVEDSDGQAALSADDRREAIRRLDDAGAEMSRVLRALLDEDRLDSGSVEPHRHILDVAAVVRFSVEETIEVESKRLILDTPSMRAPVDPVFVDTIVRNLVKNAVQYSPPGEPIIVRVRSHRDGTLLIVEDRGPGVARRYRRVIFEPFTRGPDASGVGLGIGLSVVSRLAAAHGGRAWVEDVPGGGAAFKVLLSARSSVNETATGARAVSGKRAS